MDRETKTVTLPLSQVEAVIKEGDGYSDRLLLKRNKKPFQVIPDYLASMTASLNGREGITRKEILALLSPDQEYIAIESFKVNYGDDFEFELTCPSCGNTAEHSFDLNKLPFKGVPEGLDPSDPVISLTLPRSGKSVEIGLLNGEKELILFEQASSGNMDLNQADFLSMRSLDGSKNFSYEDVVNLPLADHAAIRKARRKLSCGYDTNIITVCEECGEKIAINILMHRAFLLPG